jgi:hypothetical protein
MALPPMRAGPRRRRRRGLTLEELQPLAQADVESLHMFEFFTCLGLTEVDEVYGVQAGSRKHALWFSSAS